MIILSDAIEIGKYKPDANKKSFELDFSPFPIIKKVEAYVLP